MKKTSRGFTLVELSIVLIIIGLIAGGLLAATSMTKTSKITKAIKELGQYEVAVQNYEEIYKEVPGDGANFSPTGNGDGSVLTKSTLYDEVPNSWRHLSLGVDLRNYANVVYPAVASVAAFTPKTNCPVLDLPHSNTACLFIIGGQTGYSRNAFFYANINNLTTGNAALLATDAIAIDKKMDNGFANSGKISDLFAYSGGSTCATGANYNLANKCSLGINIDMYQLD